MNICKTTEEQKRHSTEVALDKYTDFDYEIDNTNSIEELTSKVISILEETYASRD